MKTSKQNIMLIISIVLLCAIASALALNTASKHLNNTFIVGQSGVQLIEVFDGVTHEGKIGEANDSFINAVMSPGKTYEKSVKIKANSDGYSYAYLKIVVPDDISEDVVLPSGQRVSEPTNIVTANFNAEEISSSEFIPNKWYKISEQKKNNNTEYVFAYTSKLAQGETTASSPIASISIANLFISDNNFSGLNTEYYVPVTAYTKSVSLDETALPSTFWTNQN